FVSGRSNTIAIWKTGTEPLALAGAPAPPQQQPLTGNNPGSAPQRRGRLAPRMGASPLEQFGRQLCQGSLGRSKAGQQEQPTVFGMYAVFLPYVQILGQQSRSKLLILLALPRTPVFAVRGHFGSCVAVHRCPGMSINALKYLDLTSLLVYRCLGTSP